MSTRSERDKAKSLQEKHQTILTSLLKDEDNKYCVDCDAKGPRWASWNLGIFLCIRCAGIHRNLGVHISKVKSVNLDTWTSEQIAMMQEMGNSRARAVYEANLQDGFRRPQTDSGLEAFIRAKYEQKKYIAREWIPPQPRAPKYVEEEPKKEKKKPRPQQTSSSSVKLPSTSPSHPEVKSTPKPVEVKKELPPAAAVDLLGLDTPETHTANDSSNADPFGDFIGSDASAQATQAQNGTTNGAVTSASNDLGDINLFANGAGGADTTTPKNTKDSILALYGSGGGGSGLNQQMNPGMQGGMYGQMGGMNGMPNNMMGMQQQNMMQQAVANEQQMMAAYYATMTQNQMWNGAMGGGMMPQQNMGGMMGGQMGANNMYNMGGMYGAGMPQQQQQQQQMQYQQLSNQMAGMNLGGQQQKMGGSYPQVNGQQQWGAQAPQQSSGQTLSTNLWQ